MDKTIQATNAGLLGLFSAYLISRGDVQPYVTAIPAISTLKYIFMSGTKDVEKKTAQWAHYVSWFLTTPIMLYLIFSLNNLPLVTMGILIALNQIMILTGWLASISNDEKDVWNWFAVGCFAFLPIVYELLQFTKGYALIVLTLATWSLYPVVWYLNRKDMIDTSTRNISYSFLDFISKAGLVVLYLNETGKLKV